MRTALGAIASLALYGSALAADIISTDGFSTCNSGDTTISVQKVDISFDKSSNTITFDVAGSSAVEQKVNAQLIVEAYGVNVYNNSFNPCDEATKVDQLCPGKYYLLCL